jgi:hypothetical protein
LCLQVRTVLFEAEAVLRASVPGEPLEHRTASRLKLERALYPPKTGAGFPLRWSVVYSMAAALTLTVLGGYLNTRLSEPQAAQLAAAPEIGTPRDALAPAAPRAAVAALESPAAPGWREPESSGMQAVRIAALVPGQTAQREEVLAAAPAASAGLPQAAALSPNPAEAELARFELLAQSRPQVEAKQFAWVDPPRVATLPNVPMAAMMPPPPVPTFRTVVQETAFGGTGSARSSDPNSFAKVIEGYWLLTQAKVWEEDLHPVWTSRGLVIEGTVEDEGVRQRVEAALLRQAARPAALRVRLREELPAAQQPSRRTRVVHAAYSGPAGGAVRRSLLSHFSDAARHSFVSPQPSALEAEVVRYVSEVYRTQSALLTHAYALQRFLDRVDIDHLTAADPQTTRRFRDLVRFHLGALDQREAAIYDRLSEALPRKVWSHRGDGGPPDENPGWNQESQGLLQDTLELDSNLTALFGSSSLTVDASDPEQSCGELLHRIRTRIQRIKNRTQAL